MIRGKVMHGHDSAFTCFCRKVRKLRKPRPLIRQTNKSQSNMFLRTIQGIGRRSTNSHTESLSIASISASPHHCTNFELTHRFKTRNLRVPIRVKILLRIINRHAPINPIRQRRILHNRHPLIRPISMFEEHRRGPVIREVFREGTCCASTLLADIPGHACVEGISADDLMEMC